MLFAPAALSIASRGGARRDPRGPGVYARVMSLTHIPGPLLPGAQRSRRGLGLFSHTQVLRVPEHGGPLIPTNPLQERKG